MLWLTPIIPCPNHNTSSELLLQRAVLLVTGLLIIYVINTGKGFPFGAGVMVMAAPIFGVIAAVLWEVEINRKKRLPKQ